MPAHDWLVGHEAPTLGARSARRQSWTVTAMAVLFVRRECWRLTTTARLIVLAVLTASAIIVAHGACDFLALNRPLGGPFMVVEGWMPPYAYREAATRFL